ncbi:MAG: FAD-dependent oxidoreductase [Magnetococcales bacterium]|nr:FAD-dependent oxidoreductase [Magnetococcales bacterium]MBF0583784.1 FAD-dependent oxidoreductase [Magnetococcales bacterium]
MEAKKIGCYICTGCGIGEALNVAALEKVASKEQKIPVTKSHPFLCGTEGIALIRQDMANEGVNALLIAACSHRNKTDEFEFNIPLLDRVDLRDKVLWVLEDGSKDSTAKEDLQMMAADYLRMGSVKLKKMNAPDPFLESGFSKDVLVVGGGVAGLTAAKEVADTGYRAILVEKSDQLGGMVARMHKTTPTLPPYRTLEDNPVQGLIAAVEGHSRIKIYKGAAIHKTQGAPGLFDVTIHAGGTETTERVGSIVLTTGYNLYDPAKLDKKLGYGSSPDVVTSLEFEEMAKAGKIVRKSDGKPAKRVAFSLCAGQRDSNHLEYCSAACCSYSLKHALYLMEQYADASAYILFQELRTPGQMEEFYRRVQEEGGVIIKGDVEKVEKAAAGGLTVQIHDKLVRGKEQLEVDLLVLATGMVSSVDTTDPNNPSPVGQVAEDAARYVLNLQYRQGRSMPELKWGFPDSHFICFPYETRRTGIYAAGPARRPMGIAETITDATGAALKAIQVVESVARGAAVHPRSGDLSYPSFRAEGCTQCKRCTEECPFGAINEDEKGNPLFNPTRCRRCGTCMGACPQKIISFANYSVDMIGSMLKEVEVPAEDEEKPRILLFACVNDAIPALDMVGQNRSKLSPYIRIIPLRCMGSMNLVWVADAMSSGFDGVLLMGCRHGDDYQCHNVRGSSLAETRLSKVSETLDRLQLESDRVKMVEVNIMDADTLPQLINDFAAQIASLAPNPYKEF